MKYVVIKVYDREITSIGVADTFEEATAIMKKDFMEEFTSYYEEDDFENCESGDEWELNDNEAWLLNSFCDCHYDWKIIEVEQSRRVCDILADIDKNFHFI